MQQEIAGDAADPQAVLPHRRQVPAAGDEVDVLAGLRQPAAEVSTHRTGSEHRYPHRLLRERDDKDT